MPTVSWLISALALPTPEPGEMPVLQICTVQPRRESLREARASTVISAAGEMRRIIPSSISTVSIPFCPSTPGITLATGRRCSKPMLFCNSLPICRVEKINEPHSGPSASGVIWSLPRPATSISPSSGNSAVSSAAMVFALSVKSAKRLKFGSSTVIYVPFFLFSLFSPFSLVILILVIFASPFFTSSHSIPSVSSGAEISLCSSARSVLKFIT